MRGERARQVVVDLYAAIRARRLYPPQHPASEAPSRRIAEALGRLAPLEIGVTESGLVCDGAAIEDPRAEERGLQRALRDIAVGRLGFQPGIALEEVRGIIDALSRAAPTDPTSLSEEWKRAGVGHAFFEERPHADSAGARARRVHERAIGVMSDLAEELQKDRSPSAPILFQTMKELRDLVLSRPETALGLTMIESDADFTCIHSVNVAILCLLYGRALELPEDQLLRFGLGGLVHDIGELRSPRAIRETPGALTAQDSRLVRLHPELGVEILGAVPRIHRETRTIVLQHHVRIDGSGYPELPPGTELHPLAEAVGLLECYEAMTSPRPYQRPRCVSEALSIVRGLAGGPHSPDLVARVLAMLGPNPVGDVVRLSTSEIAVVVACDPISGELPGVRIVIDAHGSRLEDFPAVRLDPNGEPSRRVVSPVDPLRKGIDVGTVIARHFTG